jgi:hypothetical protein
MSTTRRRDLERSGGGCPSVVARAVTIREIAPGRLNAASPRADAHDVDRPRLSAPSLTDVVGGLVLLAIAALLVAIAVVTAAG